MKVINIFFIIISIFYIISCNDKNDKSQVFWVRVNILKELKYSHIMVNGISYEENKELREEYTKNTNIYMFEPDSPTAIFDYFFFKFPSNYTVDDLKDYKIEIKDNDKIIWTGVAYNENDFSKCGFYQMKDEPSKDKIKEISIHFIEKDKNGKLLLEGKYYSNGEGSLICNSNDNKQNKVMISINLANNTFDDNYIEKINDIDVDNGR